MSPKNDPADLNRLVPADEALEIVLQDAGPLGIEEIPLKSTAWRILAADLSAKRTQPPFPASSMDGYAVKQKDVSSCPATLSLVGESAAGHPFDGTVHDGEAVRIFTGAVLPEGADTIIIQENTKANGNQIEVLNGSLEGKFIRPAGMDFEEGDVLLKAGDSLNVARLSLAASMNHPTVPVYRKPLVALLATGDELVMPGESVGDGQIIASNTFGIAAMMKKLGAEILDLGIALDTLPALSEKIEQALAAKVDLIITMGGASVGDHDLVKPAFDAAGFDIKLAKIAMRPGKPFLFSTKTEGGRVVRMAGLAGNPVSSLIASHVFLKPLVNQLSGKPPNVSAPQDAKLAIDLPPNDEREEYMRAVSTLGADGSVLVTPFLRQDSSQLNRLVQADCLMIRPKNAPEAKIGDNCQIVRMDD